MLWDASVIKGYAIEAEDGRLGAVSDFLFEDACWMVRWLVVDTGHWLRGRKVLLPPSALGHPDPRRRQFPVKLTMQQVKYSPGINTQRPVSRQMEEHIYDYYAWDPYWLGAMATPFVAPLYLPGSTAEHQSAEPEPKEGDPHLRSIGAVTGYRIYATDGEAGPVEDFLVEDASWNIGYLVVDTRNWWAAEQVLVSPRTVREINWAERSIHLNLSRQQIKNARAYDPDRMADRADEDLMLKYYRRRA